MCPQEMNAWREISVNEYFFNLLKRIICHRKYNIFVINTKFLTLVH